MWVYLSATTRFQEGPLSPPGLPFGCTPVCLSYNQAATISLEIQSLHRGAKNYSSSGVCTRAERSAKIIGLWLFFPICFFVLCHCFPVPPLMHCWQTLYWRGVFFFWYWIRKTHSLSSKLGFRLKKNKIKKIHKSNGLHIRVHLKS